MGFRFAVLIVLAAGALMAGPAAPAQMKGPSAAGQAHPYIPPGPCGYGRVQKTLCEVHKHPPKPPITTCKRVCVAG